MIVVLLIAMTYYRLPWRKLPTPARSATPRRFAEPVPVEPSLPRPQRGEG